ncbi:hypothetical protein BK120_29730 [Paenibacillus sp. FSL A5-0031]|uniref:hypothetical protein n=1 Tax=Paenibacillus sp. FSL A5-0031 TaxID=1920420 RepID=UPI00096BE083|nr:hypothetical protein [Paenibacillus sp. FSL A5-0031]OME76158.1 hypothetical protein BK120_29730 [Paenibacillus sp. FSL A5-0031]
MIKRVSLLIIVFTFMIGSTTYAYNEKPSSDERVPFEKMYFEYGGYKTVEDALSECNRHFRKKITLPFKLPPIPFTHQLARCNQHGGVVNDYFEIEYLNELQGSNNHYMIWVNPSGHRKGFPRKSNVIRIYELENGEKAVYGTTPTLGDRPPAFDVLRFEKNGLQYILSVDKRVEDKVTAYVLVDIANSIK